MRSRGQALSHMQARSSQILSNHTKPLNGSEEYFRVFRAKILSNVICPFRKSYTNAYLALSRCKYQTCENKHFSKHHIQNVSPAECTRDVRIQSSRPVNHEIKGQALVIFLPPSYLPTQHKNTSPILEIFIFSLLLQAYERHAALIYHPQILQSFLQNMSPLALYIEQASFHEPFFFPSPIPNVSVYPPSPPNNQIFDSLHSAPTLEKSRTNRVLLYPGSFNPPHRGHLHLLKHAFTRGTHDLNVIAAMVLPHSDASVYTKVKAENGKFMFGIEERCLLWKQDLCFPAWAWVYNKSGQSFAKFSERLLQVVEKDGFSLEFVPLYGAGIASPDSPPSPAYGCKTIIMTNAARRADFQRSSGRLRDFEGCTKWRGIRINKDRLRHNAELYASRNLLEMKTICPQEAYNMLKDGMSKTMTPLF